MFKSHMKNFAFVFLLIICFATTNSFDINETLAERLLNKYYGYNNNQCIIKDSIQASSQIIKEDQDFSIETASSFISVKVNNLTLK